MQGVKGTYSLTRLCQQCGIGFHPKLSTVKKGYGKFCSHQCYARSLEGIPHFDEHNKKISEGLKASPIVARWRNKVERVCEACRKIFFTFPCNIKIKKGKFCSAKCRDNYHSVQANVIKICKGCGIEFVIKQHQLKRRRFCSLNCRRQFGGGKNAPTFGYFFSKETKEKHSQAMKKLWQDSTFREKSLATIIKNSQNPEYILKQSITHKKSWQDPKFVAKMIASRSMRPTIPEKHLIEICSKHFSQFKYNGDFSLGVTLQGLIPDFVNTNGRKEVIEVFGDYFHSPEVLGDRWQGSELGKIMLYNSLGYRCLVLWEHDLKKKSEDDIVDMIRHFERGGKKCRV